MCCDGFIVGSLGTWDPEKDHLLREIGIGRKYRTLIKSSAAVMPFLVVTECGLPDPVCMLVGLPARSFIKSVHLLVCGWLPHGLSLQGTTDWEGSGGPHLRG